MMIFPVTLMRQSNMHRFLPRSKYLNLPSATLLNCEMLLYLRNTGPRPSLSSYLTSSGGFIMTAFTSWQKSASYLLHSPLGFPCADCVLQKWGTSCGGCGGRIVWGPYSGTSYVQGSLPCLLLSPSKWQYVRDLKNPRLFLSGSC